MKLLKNNLFFSLALIAVTVCLCSGCSDETKPEKTLGSLIENSGCKPYESEDKQQFGFSEACIIYNYGSNGTLTIEHNNTAFNCCYTPDITVSITNSIITITEQGIGEMPCDCICLFDLTYEIPNLNSGTYQLIINQGYVRDDDEHGSVTSLL